MGFFLGAWGLENPDNKALLKLYDYPKERTATSKIFTSKIWLLATPHGF
jgi:hypothetical protein